MSVTTASTVGLLLFSSMSGYAFAKGRFPGKGALFSQGISGDLPMAAVWLTRLATG